MAVTQGSKQTRLGTSVMHRACEEHLTKRWVSLHRGENEGGGMKSTPKVLILQFKISRQSRPNCVGAMRLAGPGKQEKAGPKKRGGNTKAKVTIVYKWNSSP